MVSKLRMIWNQAHETVRTMSPLEIVAVLQTEQQYATSLPCFALAWKLGTHTLPVFNQLQLPLTQTVIEIEREGARLCRLVGMRACSVCNGLELKAGAQWEAHLAGQKHQLALVRRQHLG